MNQTELNQLSALVERRLALRALLQSWEREAKPSAPTPEQRQALRQLLEERAEDQLRLEELFRRLTDQLDRLEGRLEAAQSDEVSTARVRRLQRDLRVLGEDMERHRGRFQPASPGEAHAAALVDPYMEDTAPMAQRVHVPEGDL